MMRFFVHVLIIYDEMSLNTYIVRPLVSTRDLFICPFIYSLKNIVIKTNICYIRRLDLGESYEKIKVEFAWRIYFTRHEIYLENSLRIVAGL